MLGRCHCALAGFAPNHQQSALRGLIVWIRRNNIIWKLKRSLLLALVSVAADEPTAGLGHHSGEKCTFLFLKDHSEGVITWTPGAEEVGSFLHRCHRLGSKGASAFLCKIFIRELSSAEAFWPRREVTWARVDEELAELASVSYVHCRKCGDFQEDGSKSFILLLWNESLSVNRVRT